ncbi:MAG: ABC transporter permease [Thermoplasmata archaeon]|nr:ABC transporter permease [Thermoplasmata archaeon]
MMNVKNELKAAMWLEFQIESNWTSPLIFAIYNILKPVGAALVLVAMFYVVVGAWTGNSLAFMYVGNAFYMILAQTLFSIGWIVHDDREHYSTLRYLYISPTPYFRYLVGRSITRYSLSIVPMCVLLLLGLALKIEYRFNLLLLTFALILGFVFIVGTALLISGINLLTARHGGAIGEAFAGIFYLASGVVFPVALLPGWAQQIALVFPTTYWFSIIRIAVLGYESDKFMGGFSVPDLCLYLTTLSFVYFFLAYLLFRFADTLARKLGILDMSTTY